MDIAKICSVCVNVMSGDVAARHMGLCGRQDHDGGDVAKQGRGSSKAPTDKLIAGQHT